jgi:hypothetical protein
MDSRSAPEGASDLRWLLDDELGRVVYAPGNGQFRSPADAINVLRLGCGEAVLRESLDRFPQHLRIHGGYTPFPGDPVTRFSLTWEPGAALAEFVQVRDGSDAERVSGKVDVPAGLALEDVLLDLLVPDARDVVGLARDQGKLVSMRDVDFWMGKRHFKAEDEEPS